MANTLIIDALNKKGMTQKELAGLLNCSEPLVSHLIRGKVQPTYRRALEIEKHLGVPHRALLDAPTPAQPVTA